MERPRAPAGLGGWLLVLCLLLTVWQPLSFALAASRALPAVAARGPAAVLVLIARLAVTGMGIAAGIALIGRRPAAVALTRGALTAGAAMEIFIVLTPYFPDNRVPGDEPLHVGAALAYYGVWMTYLSRSRRVRSLTS